MAKRCIQKSHKVALAVINCMWQEILDRTGYSLDVTTGQRKYGGPPPNWDLPQPGAGHEVMYKTSTLLISAKVVLSVGVCWDPYVTSNCIGIFSEKCLHCLNCLEMGPVCWWEVRIQKLMAPFLRLTFRVFEWRVLLYSESEDPQ